MEKDGDGAHIFYRSNTVDLDKSNGTVAAFPTAFCESGPNSALSTTVYEEKRGICCVCEIYESMQLPPGFSPV